VRADVTADLDYNRVTTSVEDFDPERQVVRSTQTIDDASTNKENDQNSQVSVATNLPDQGGAGAGGEGTTAASSEHRTEETVNYEIAKTIRNEVKEGGVVKKLSVAVLVDGLYDVDPTKGSRTFKPRSKEELDQLTSLVRGAIGYNAARGDSIDLVNMQFADMGAEEKPELELFFGLNKNDLLRIAEILVLSIVAILVILLVVRPLVSRAFEALPSPGAMGPEGLLTAQAGAPALPGGRPVPAPGEEEESGFDELIDIDRVEGRVKASSVKKVGEIVEKHPDEALAIIRSWMYQQE
jgi:flagellar M-ring protein FliF